MTLIKYNHIQFQKNIYQKNKLERNLSEQAIILILYQIIAIHNQSMEAALCFFSIYPEVGKKNLIDSLLYLN